MTPERKAVLLDRLQRMQISKLGTERLNPTLPRNQNDHNLEALTVAHNMLVDAMVDFYTIINELLLEK